MEIEVPLTSALHVSVSLVVHPYCISSDHTWFHLLSALTQNGGQVSPSLQVTLGVDIIKTYSGQKACFIVQSTTNEILGANFANYKVPVSRRNTN